MIDLDKEKARVCSPTDGLYEPVDSECLRCHNKCAEVCKIFAVFTGRKEYSDFKLPKIFKGATDE